LLKLPGEKQGIDVKNKLDAQGRVTIVTRCITIAKSSMSVSFAIKLMDQSLQWNTHSRTKLTKEIQSDDQIV
jgi:hypothetical protein